VPSECAAITRAAQVLQGLDIPAAIVVGIGCALHRLDVYQCIVVGLATGSDCAILLCWMLLGRLLRLHFVMPAASWAA